MLLESDAGSRRVVAIDGRREELRSFWNGNDTIQGKVAAILALSCESLVVIAILVDLTVTFINTIGRYVFGGGLDWATDLSSVATSLIAFIGGAAYYRRGTGMAYTALVDRTHGLTREALKTTGIWISLVICAQVLYVAPAFLQSKAMQMLPVLNISQVYVSIWVVVGFALLVLFGIEKLLRFSWRGQLIGFGITALLVVLLLLMQALFDAASLPVDPLLGLLPLGVVGLVCGMPIALVLALGGMSFLFVTGSAPLVAAPATFEAGVSSFLLVAIPFFLLAGVLMDITGMARRLVDLIQEWVGHWRGGLLLASIVSIYVFSGMSGSKAADVATVGSVMKEPLRHRGYPPSESVAVLAAAAAMGEVIPPSVALLILGSVTTLSVGTLFMAGIAPAALLAVTLMIGVLIRARLYHFPQGPAFSIRRAIGCIPAALPALLVPLIVLGGIVGGIASATEASSFAVVYGIVVALLFYRSLKIQMAWAAFRDAAVTSGMVLLMMATSNLLSQSIVIDGLGLKLSDLLSEISNPRAFLFLSMAALIVLGFVLEGFPAILITAPILIPIAQQHGIDPLYYGVLLTMAVGIGVFMPPVGIGYYVACAVGEASPHETMLPSLIYNTFLIIGFVLCIIFPIIILGVPHMLGL